MYADYVLNLKDGKDELCVLVIANLCIMIAMYVTFYISHKIIQ